MPTSHLDRDVHAITPPTKNAKAWKVQQAWSMEQNESLKTIKWPIESLWKKWSGYHRRILFETKMHCIKLLGDKLTARSFPLCLKFKLLKEDLNFYTKKPYKH